MDLLCGWGSCKGTLLEGKARPARAQTSTRLRINLGDYAPEHSSPDRLQCAEGRVGALTWVRAVLVYKQQASQFIALSLSFLICKMGIIIHSAWGNLWICVHNTWHIWDTEYISVPFHFLCQETECSPDWWGSFVGHSPAKQKINSSISSLGTCVGCGLVLVWGSYDSQQIDVYPSHQCVSPSLSLPFPLFLT